MFKSYKKYIIIVATMLLFPVLCFLYAYYEARSIGIKKIDFVSADVPESFIGKKIIFISDIHSSSHFTKDDVKTLVSKVNERNPDIILLGGDYTWKSAEYSRPFFDEIKKLESRYGVYTVLGNHDHWEDEKFIQQELTGCGFKTCDNQSYWIREGNDSIKIGGVGDFWEDEQLLENTISDLNKSDFCILLSHNPDYMEMLDTDLVDLMLSGHTHGGQITLFGLWAPILPSTFHPDLPQTGQKYRYGWVKKDNTSLYITSGIGMGGVPLRFFAPPEIVEITLKKD
ncbi:MAG: metallophosphoesterase [Prevotella sp.]|jgi:predicted MPP superfamily phosphohydrolase|nr:metallophosphoesterase [Prevotella sp.]